MKVKIVKQAEALPVRLVRDGSDDEVDEAAAVREVDLQKKFHWSFYDLADKLGITSLAPLHFGDTSASTADLTTCMFSSSALKGTIATLITP